MILFAFASLFALAAAGPDEDTADKILSAFIKDNGGKSVPMSTLVYPYQLVLGVFTTSIDVTLTNGQMNLNSFSRLSSVDNKKGLAFTGQISAHLSYTYDFRSAVPAGFAAGNAAIDWEVPVSMNVVVDENNKASLDSIRLLYNGTLVGNLVPQEAGRSATLYPKGNSSFVLMLFSSLQDYLRRTFQKIAF